MTELCVDAKEKALVVGDGADDIILDKCQPPTLDARKRVENFLEEKRLRDEIEDFLDYGIK